jgi:hypothetical protein
VKRRSDSKQITSETVVCDAFTTVFDQFAVATAPVDWIEVTSETAVSDHLRVVR